MGILPPAAGVWGSFQVPANLLIEVPGKAAGGVGSRGTVSEDGHLVGRANGELPTEETGDAGKRWESGKGGCAPALLPSTNPNLPSYYLRGSVSSSSTNPKDAYMSTSCSSRRVSCWEISNSCMEKEAS